MKLFKPENQQKTTLTKFEIKMSGKYKQSFYCLLFIALWSEWCLLLESNDRSGLKPIDEKRENFI